MKLTVHHSHITLNQRKFTAYHAQSTVYCTSSTAHCLRFSVHGFPFRVYLANFIFALYNVHTHLISHSNQNYWHGLLTTTVNASSPLHPFCTSCLQTRTNWVQLDRQIEAMHTYNTKLSGGSKCNYVIGIVTLMKKPIPSNAVLWQDSLHAQRKRAQLGRWENDTTCSQSKQNWSVGW